MVRTSERELHTKLIGKFEKNRNIVYLFCVLPYNLLEIYLLSRNTNKMQLCNRIYYSKVYWKFNMFRAAHCSSSGALNCICSLWFIYLCGDQPLPRLSGNGWSPHGYINQRLQIQFRVPDDDERCAARNMLSLQ